VRMDDIDRQLLNQLQHGVPVCEHPFADLAMRLHISEQQLVERLMNLQNDGVLMRIGPLYNAEKLGGAYTLAAMQIPEHDFERVSAMVNTHKEVAHNYQRRHRFNMWFVLAAGNRRGIDDVLRLIESETGYPVFDMRKLEEYCIGLRFETCAC
jgi:DNA-binding Lrp family transcriptional regulator